MLSISPLTEPFYSFSFFLSFSWLQPFPFSPSHRFFTLLLLSCHHSHLNPVRRGPDRADWFPVRRCLEHILELSGHIHPPLLHSNLKRRPCLLLCCRHAHKHTKYIRLYKQKHAYTATCSLQYSNFSIWLFPPKGPCLITKHHYCHLYLN